MNPFTASTALAITQLCNGLIMAGIFLTMPSERCARYWALSGALASFGVIIVVVMYASGPSVWRSSGLLIGNTCLFAASVAAWGGLRSFYLRPVKLWSWFITAVYGLIFAVFLALDAPFTQRAYFAVGSMQLVFVLLLLELKKGGPSPGRRRPPRWTFGRYLGVISLLILSAAYIARLILSSRHPALFEPPLMSDVGVMLIYMIPLGGSLLFSAALLLLYFERLVADKQRLATEDVLTGTLNRRELVRAGERMVNRAITQRENLALAFIDVDHFKRINDQFGHLTGDRVLAGIAAILKQNCREGDLLGRYGGEEFCGVFPGLDLEEAQGIGARLVDAVRQQSFAHGEPVTISVGLVVLEPGMDLNWDSLVHRADVALYRAKAEGRNAFRMADAA